MNREAVAPAFSSPAPAEQAVWQFLIEHRDSQADDGETPAAVVSRVRQEEIAQSLDLPLGQVIEAIRRLQRCGRLRAEPQAVGQPFRYRLESCAPQQDAPARAA